MQVIIVLMERLDRLMFALQTVESLLIDSQWVLENAMTSTTIRLTDVILIVMWRLAMSVLTQVLELILALSRVEMAMIFILISAMMEIPLVQMAVHLIVLLKQVSNVWEEIPVDQMSVKKFVTITQTGISSNVKEVLELIMMDAIQSVRLRWAGFAMVVCHTLKIRATQFVEMEEQLVRNSAMMVTGLVIQTHILQILTAAQTVKLVQAGLAGIPHLTHPHIAWKSVEMVRTFLTMVAMMETL